VLLLQKSMLCGILYSHSLIRMSVFSKQKKGDPLCVHFRQDDPLCVHFRQVTHYVYTLDRVHCSLVYSSFNLSSTTFAYDMPRESDGTELLYKVL
jgi:hypothetical protein